MITHPLFCPYCEGDQVIRHGTAKGKQRYCCQSCTRTFRENPQSRAYPEERKREILAAYHERSSLRGLRRIFGVSRTTVSAWLKQEAQTLPPPGADPSAGESRGGSGTR
jgi:transposase-like protein